MIITTKEQLQRIISTHKIIGITGNPGAGKTTLSKTIEGRKVIHTDHYLSHKHESIPDMILNEVKDLKNYIIEGTQVVRLFKRGWQPDVILYLTGSNRTDTKGLNTMITTRMKTYTGKVYTFNPRLLRE